MHYFIRLHYIRGIYLKEEHNLIMKLLIITIIFIIVIGVIVTISNLKKRQRQLDSVLKNTDNFSASFTVKDFESKYMFCIDDDKGKILYTNTDDNASHLFNFENVISVEIIEDSNTTYSKSATRTIGGSVIGGIIGGGAGAIIGGLSGSNKGKKKVKEIKVKILLRDYPTSSIYIECLKNEQIEHNCDSFTYKVAMEEAVKISDKLSVIIDMVDREEKARFADTSVNKPTASFSITDEIEKLYSLKERGIISEEEFVKLKKKLL